MLTTFVDIEDSCFDDAGAVLPLAGEVQAQLTVELPTGDGNHLAIFEKRGYRPAVRLVSSQFSQSFSLQ